MSFDELYDNALRGFVATGEEDTLTSAYELGRTAVQEDLSVLELCNAHHAALERLVTEDHPGGAAGVVEAGGSFFCQALSAYDKLQRALQEASEAAQAERQQVAVMRRLSAFLGDASIAFDAASSLGEMLQLVAEHAREILDADRCVVTAQLTQDAPLVAEVEREDGRHAGAEGRQLAAPLTALDGRVFGGVAIEGQRRGRSAELDADVLTQLAQMASAAIERAQLYRS